MSYFGILSNCPLTKVLENYDLVEMIFQYLDEDDVRKCAMINRIWCKFALDIIWRTVEFKKLVKILWEPSTEKKGKVPGWKLISALDSHVWQNFRSYARRVQNFEYPEYEEGYISTELCREFINNALDDLPILPNLRSFSINIRDSEFDCAKEILRLLHDKVTSVEIWRDSRRHNDAMLPDEHLIINEIFRRVPRLEHFLLNNEPCLNWNVEKAFRAALPKYGMRSLASVQVSFDFQTQECLQILSELPNLESLRLIHVNNYDTVQDLIVPWENMFPKIRRFDLLTTLEEFHLFLENSLPFWKPIYLKDLRLYLVEGYTGSRLHDCFLWLQTMCPCMEMIKIRLLENIEEPAIYLDPARLEDDYGLLTSSTLIPLSCMENLTVFEIKDESQCTRTVQINDTEFVEWLKCCPKLTKLHFVPDHVRIDTVTTKLTPSLLTQIATVKPDMTHLSLFIDARSMRSVLISPSPTDVRLVKLEEIYFGVSPCLKSGPLANLLSYVIPPSCNMESLKRTTWRGVFDDVRKLHELEEIMVF